MVSTDSLIKLLRHPATERDFLDSGTISESYIIRELTFAAAIVSGNTALQKADAPTVFRCVLSVCSTGLTLDPNLGFAYLIPYKEVCKVMPSYKGLSHLLFKAGNVIGINAQIVCENDDFTLDLADNINPVTHKIKIGDRGNKVGVYAIATFRGGMHQVEVMEKKEVEYIRSTSEGWKRQGQSSIWGQYESEMWRKTVIKRISKYLPKNEGGYEKLQTAIRLDNEVNEFDLPVAVSQCQDIDELLRKAQLTEGEYQKYRLGLDTMQTQSQYKVLRAELLQRQPLTLDEQFDSVVNLQ